MTDRDRDLEMLSDQNPPPSLDDASVPIHEEPKAPERAKPKEPSFIERRRAFFDDLADEPDPLSQATGAAEPEAPSAPGRDPARERLDRLMTPEAESPTAASLLEEEAREPAVTKPADQATEKPAEKPAEKAPEEFRTADGLRYRGRSADGTLVDPLSSLGGLTIEVYEDGQWREIPAERVPHALQQAMRFNREQHELAAARAALAERQRELEAATQALAREYADLERYRRDPDYRARVDQELERLGTAEGQVEELQRQVRELRTQLQSRTEHDDTRVAAELVATQVVAPALEALAKAHPALEWDDIQTIYAAGLAQFPPGSLKMQRGQDGRFYPLNPTAWQAFEQFLKADLPARVQAKARRLAERIGTPQSPKDSVAARQTRADKEAATVRAELARNQAASRHTQGAGLPPGREAPRRPIRTIQDGRKWLQDEE